FAAAVSFGASALLRIGYRAVRGQDGLGFGDVKFLGAGALWIGLEQLPGLVMVAVLSALLSLVILHRHGERLSRSYAMSFGPHLAVGLWLAWVVGRFASGN